MVGSLGEQWQSTLRRARRVQVPVNCRTEEFRVARRLGLECDPEDGEEWQYGLLDRHWVYYELRRRLRHKWGQYLRSKMDWDWDLGACMNRLFKERPAEQSEAVYGVSTSSPAVGMAASPEETLMISI